MLGNTSGTTHNVYPKQEGEGSKYPPPVVEPRVELPHFTVDHLSVFNSSDNLQQVLPGQTPTRER